MAKSLQSAGARRSALFSVLLAFALIANLAIAVSPLGQIARADTYYSFQKIALSGDGTTFYLVNSGGSIWKSGDSGGTWSSLPSAGERSWASIATSQDGSVVVAADGAGGAIYISRDFGVTWSELTGAGSRNWRTIVLSSDGSKIKAITTNTVKLYESNDFGATWSENSTLPTVLNVNNNPDGTRSSSGCTNPCSVPSWAELTISGSGNKIALLVSAPGSYESGRQLFISQDGGSTWIETLGCCRDQSSPRQIASSRSDTNWTIMMGNYQSNPGYLRYDSVNQVWGRVGLRVHERSGDATSVQLTTWRGFAIAADGDQVIFTGAWAGWVPSQQGRNESLFTGSISTELAGIYHDESPGSSYDDVAISDSGLVRAAVKSSTGEITISTDGGLTFSKRKIFELPLTPSIGSQVEYADSYTVLVSNYDPTFTWSVSTSSGTASIDSSGLVTVNNPLGRSLLTVRTNKSGVNEGVATFSARDLHAHRTTAATWSAVPAAVGSPLFNGSIYKVATNPLTGDIYVGGNFTNFGGDPDADYIARFDGTAWHSLVGSGGGLSSGTGNGSAGVFAIAFDSYGTLYTGGNFANAGGDPNADFLARWNGSQWASVGRSNLTGSLRDIEILNNGNVAIAGQFRGAGSVTGADYIAQWDGTSWSKLGESTLNGYVLSIAESRHGAIYISGHFDGAGGDSNANKLAMLSSGQWVAVGTGITNSWSPIQAVVVDDSGATDVVYAGGYFWDGSRVQGIYKWSGSTWSPLDFGFTNSVRSLYFDSRYGLFFTGWFSTDNRYATGLGLYVNDTFYGIGDSTNNGSGAAAATSYVESIALTQDGSIYIGGMFSSVAGLSDTQYLAKTTAWTPAVVLESTPAPSNTGETSEERKARAASEREAKVKVARANVIEKLRNGETLTAELAKEASLPALKISTIDAANQTLLAQDVETRTVEANIVKIFTKYAILDDLTQTRPQSFSSRDLISYGIINSDAIYPTLTLLKLKKLPIEKRSDFTSLFIAIAEIQKNLEIREKRLAQVLNR